MSTRAPHTTKRFVTCLFLAVSFQLALSTAAYAAPGKCDAGVFDLACEAGKSVAGKAGKVITAPVRVATGGAVDMLTTWVSEGAHWLLGKVITVIDDSTSPDLRAEWFEERYRFMVGLGSLIVLPMLLLAAIRAVMQQDVSQLLRSFFLYLPLAVFGAFVAILLTQSLLAVTDELSEAVAGGIAGDTSKIVESVSDGLTHAPGPAGTPSFAIFFGALLLIIGSFFVWLELLVRSAAVTVSVFFLPLILAALVWPTTAHWTRRMLETMVALILSKFVIVAVISLATSALADPGGGGFGSVMGAAALMLMAAFSPLALLKLMPAAEGGATAHLDGLSRKPIQTMRSGGSVNHALSMMRSKVGGNSGPRVGVAAAATGGSGAVLASVGGAPVAGVTRAAVGTTARRGEGSKGQSQSSPTGRRQEATGTSAGGATSTGAAPGPSKPPVPDRKHRG